MSSPNSYVIITLEYLIYLKLGLLTGEIPIMKIRTNIKKYENSK